MSMNAPLPEDHEFVQAILASLKGVYDPEIPVNIVDLGLIYRIEAFEDGYVEIDMTLTAPGCPVAGEIVMMVEGAARRVEKVDDVIVNLVWDPPWDKSRMSEVAQVELDMF